MTEIEVRWQREIKATSVSKVTHREPTYAEVQKVYPASKVFNKRTGEWTDVPEHSITKTVVTGFEERSVDVPNTKTKTEWRTAWVKADALKGKSEDEVLAAVLATAPGPDWTSDDVNAAVAAIMGN